MKPYHKILIIPLSFLFVVNLFSQESINIVEHKLESAAYNLIGKQVPNFYALTLSQDTVNQDSFFGFVSLLQFLYFPCRPCMLEIPHFNYISQEYYDRGLRIYAVIPNRPIDIESFQVPLDSNSTFAHYKQTFKYEKINYPILPECLSNDIAIKENTIGADCDRISRIFLRDSYPISYLIDKKGVIREVFVGFDTNNQENNILLIKNYINKLLLE